MKNINTTIENAQNWMLNNGYTPEDIYETGMRLGELSVEIELYTETNNAEKLTAAKQELADITSRIQNGMAFYEAIRQESIEYNAAA
ncbi:MAG: hypothetical protein IJQ25_09090 [Oscillibacter sp.]|nr:hypothetical protein [Oscillibacter sp.]